MKKIAIYITLFLALVLLTSCEKEKENCWICDVKNDQGVVIASQIMCDDYTAHDEAYLRGKGCRPFK